MLLLLLLLLLRSRGGFIFLSTLICCCSKRQASATGLLRVIWNQLCEQEQHHNSDSMGGCMTHASLLHGSMRRTVSCQLLLLSGPGVDSAAQTSTCPQQAQQMVQ